MLEHKLQIDYKLQITITATQARLIESALDLYVRLGLGQTDKLAEFLDDLFPGHYELLETIMEGIKMEVCGCPKNGSLGIANKKVKPEVKTSYDLMKCIEKGIAEAEEHAEYSIWHDGDLLHLGTEPTPEVKIVQDGEIRPVEVMRHSKR